MASAGIFATAGAKLYIGQALAPLTVAFVAADFATQSWVEVGFNENIGEFGDQSANIKFDSIEQSRTYKLKGNRDAGDMKVVCGIDSLDAGQLALYAAEALPNNFAFKILFNDMPVGGTSGSIRYFIGLVMDVRETLDTANTVMKLNTTVAINSNVVRVAAA